MALVLPVTVSVLVPATSANLGPGFDSLGLALQLYNRFEVEESRGDPLLPEIEVEGKLGKGLPTGPDNLFFRSFALLFERLGVPVPAVRIRMTINIPHGCGLGSSATAVVGGLMAANEWLVSVPSSGSRKGIDSRSLPTGKVYPPNPNGSSGNILGPQGLSVSKEKLLDLAVEAEAGNHPDNVAPALLGGLVATTNLSGDIQAIKTHFPDELKAVIFTPSFPMDTVAGRKLLPASYPKADVTFNTGRVALLLTALQTGRYELIGEAMQDRLHQPYRQALFPAMPAIIDAAVAAGAHGASLSGGGSSLIALASENFSAILRAMQETARSLGVEGTGMILHADQSGARVLNLARRPTRKDI